MKTNVEILSEREAEFNKKQGARVGDFLKLPHGEYVRFSHDWKDSLQTSSGGSYYLGNGYISMSGGLDSGVNRSDIQQTDEKKNGSVWFFDRGVSGAYRGRHFEMSFRVFELKQGADTSGIPQIKAHQKKLIRDKAEKITRINGNGQEYTLPVPELILQTRTLSDEFLADVEQKTGLKFEKCAWNYQVQPMKQKQIDAFLKLHDFKTTYYNNSCYQNALSVEFPE